MVSSAKKIGIDLNATVANMRFITPLDEDLIKKAALEHTALITIEENTVAAGAGSAINECLNRLGLRVPVLNIGLPCDYGEHGERGELLQDCGLDEDGIRHQIENFMATLQLPNTAEQLSVTH